ncbi:hypothetical protein Zmor_011718 [Zophobas morio]|uniref:Uncharacterized protein n=1 Tax=Zophobas morio TaxID=2755281 RepID=A0AA38IRG0_9CUCU|nr:hypothetical protein Zmor_011718 [Zophobas morio]
MAYLGSLPVLVPVLESPLPSEKPCHRHRVFFLSPSKAETVVHASLPSPRSPPGSPCRLRAISRSQGRRPQSQEESVLREVAAQEERPCRTFNSLFL